MKRDFPVSPRELVVFTRISAFIILRKVGECRKYKCNYYKYRRFKAGCSRVDLIKIRYFYYLPPSEVEIRGHNLAREREGREEE